MPGPVPLAYLEDSPVGALCGQIAAGLASGTIPFTCAHPAAAWRLSLPSRVLLCAGCAAEAPGGPDSIPGPCAACESPAGCTWSWWTDEAAHVLVIARLCGACVRSGNLSAALN